MKPFFLTLTFITFLSFGYTQKVQTSVTGVVVDTAQKIVLPFTTVSLVSAKDSSLVSFALSNEEGRFTISGITKSGSYLLSASYVGYGAIWFPVTVELGKKLDIGNLMLTDVKYLKEVVVTAKRPPIEMKNDTLEFNTENFKTQPNAVVEDLLKRLPGVTIDADGTVRVNGQRINKVLVNGREFFSGDPKMATKNLDADAVDKVQLFDKKSAQSEFTGFDDGKSEKAINLKLKKDRDNAVFGRVTAAKGDENRYSAKTNINKFKGEKQLSFIGMANNVNEQGFSLNDIMNFTGELNRALRNGGGSSTTFRTNVGNDDRYGLPVSGMGQNQQGVATTIAGGANYNNRSKNKKTDVNGSLVASDVRLLTEKQINRNNLFPTNPFDFISTATKQKNGQQQRANFDIDHKLDSFHSIKITPQITFQQGQTKSVTNFLSATKGNIKLNDGYTNEINNTSAVNFANSILFRKKFRKKGRTFSTSIDFDYNQSKLNGFLITQNTVYSPTNQIQNINQQNFKNASTFGVSVNASFTEALDRKTLLQINGYYNFSSGESNAQTFDFNPASNSYSFLNTTLSNLFKNEYKYGGATVYLKRNTKYVNISIGTSLQNAILTAKNLTQNTQVQQNFTDWLPNAFLQIKVSKNNSINLNYTTSTQQPSTQLLQPIPDISDPLNIFVGNPSLKRTYMHNLSLSYNSINIVKGSNVFIIGSYNIMNNAIVFDNILQANGKRITTPFNANGVTNLFTTVNFGMPIKKLKSRVGFDVSYNQSKSVGLVNTQENTIVNSSISTRMSWTFTVDKIVDIIASGRINFSRATYSLQQQLNNNFTQSTVGVEMINYLPWKLNLRSEFNYITNTGRSDGFNASIPLLNVSLAKSFLKNNRGELKFSVNDVLNKNLGINRNANNNFIEDVRYNVLQRFFMLSFSYSLHKSGGSNPVMGGAVIKTFGGGN
ncbi:MAG: outer membrane beta-barrel protein [Chitinophagaceae bacterium]